MTTYLDSAAAFGAYMRTERQRRGWSMQTAADKIGMPAVVIGSYERGNRQPPLDRAIGFVEAYGLRLAVIGPEDVLVRGHSRDSRVEWVVVYGEQLDGLVECGSREEAVQLAEFVSQGRVAFRTHTFGELTFAGES